MGGAGLVSRGLTRVREFVAQCSVGFQADAFDRCQRSNRQFFRRIRLRHFRDAIGLGLRNGGLCRGQRFGIDQRLWLA